MPQEYAPVPEVAKVTRQLINNEHSHLGPVRIEYVFVSECPKVAGKIQWGRAKKVSGLNAYLASENQEPGIPDEFFVIEIVRPVWTQLDEKSKKALIDHELTHCWVDDEDGLSIKPHDLEEFNAIVRKYGLWRDDVELFIEAAHASKQRDLGFETISIGLTGSDDQVTMSAEQWKKTTDRINQRD